MKYIALNPGTSYRGFHDSLVNFGEGGPEMILCTQEEIAVAIANGYARVTVQTRHEPQTQRAEEEKSHGKRATRSQ